MRLELVAQGTVTANGLEQLLVEDTQLSNLSGFIDLSKVEAGDSVIIRQYIDIDGAYQLYAEETYTGVQSQPIVCITPKTSNSKMKVTLQQTGGTYRQFGYEFNREI